MEWLAGPGRAGLWRLACWGLVGTVGQRGLGRRAVWGAMRMGTVGGGGG